MKRTAIFALKKEDFVPSSLSKGSPSKEWATLGQGAGQNKATQFYLLVCVCSNGAKCIAPLNYSVDSVVQICDQWSPANTLPLVLLLPLQQFCSLCYTCPTFALTQGYLDPIDNKSASLHILLVQLLVHNVVVVRVCCTALSSFLVFSLGIVSFTGHTSWPSLFIASTAAQALSKSPTTVTTASALASSAATVVFVHRPLNLSSHHCSTSLSIEPSELTTTSVVAVAPVADDC